MLRHFSKKSSSGKQGKRGVILVTILFILAVAFIFITAAMLMTMGTRDRLYAKAENSQAKLTVTTVATTFLQSYNNQTLTETAFTNLINQAQTNPVRIGASAPAVGASAGIPGLTSADDNCTDLSVTKNGNTYYLDFTTTIGTETASVRMTMNPKQSTPPTSSFQHQLQLGSGGRMENVTVGCAIDPTDAYGNDNVVRYDPVPFYGHDNNSLLSMGDSTSLGGQAHIASTWYTNSPLSAGSNMQVYADVIFFGRNAGINLNGLSGNSFHGNGTNLYFINDTLDNPESILWYDNQRVDAGNISNFSYNNEWICGFDQVALRNMQLYVELNQNIQGSAHFYTSDDANVTFGNADAESKWNELVGNYATVEGACNAYWDEVAGNGYTDPADANYPSNKTYGGFLSENNYDFLSLSPDSAGGTTPTFTANGTLNPGIYVLGNSEFNIGAGNKVTCDLSLGRYIFYVQGDYTFKSGTLEFKDGDITDPDKTAFFVIGSNGSLRFEPYNPNGHATGIVSTNCFTGGDVKRENIIQTTKPAIMVLGAGCSTSGRCVPQSGSDHVTDGQIYYDGNGNEAVLTAYINLLPTTANSTAYGSMCGNRAGKCLIFYGRLYCNTVYGGNAGEVIMPYCPAPDDQVSSDFVEYQPNYRCDGFAYFHA